MNEHVLAAFEYELAKIAASLPGSVAHLGENAVHAFKNPHAQEVIAQRLNRNQYGKAIAKMNTQPINTRSKYHPRAQSAGPIEATQELGRASKYQEASAGTAHAIDSMRGRHPGITRSDGVYPAVTPGLEAQRAKTIGYHNLPSDYKTFPDSPTLFQRAVAKRKGSI